MHTHILYIGIIGDVQSSDETMISMSSVSYAAQSAFILSATVRENILFGSRFDEERYEKVLDACCLRPDLLQWPAGGKHQAFCLFDDS